MRFFLKKIIFLIVTVFLTYSLLFSQESIDFEYFKGYSQETDLQDAKINSIINALDAVDISSFQNSNISLMRQFEVEVYTEDLQKKEIASELMQKGYSDIISGLTLSDESITQETDGSFKSYVTLKKTKEKIDPIVNREENKIPLLKSAFIPGWGQLSKGENKKAKIIFFSEITMIGASVLFKLSDNYFTKKANDQFYTDPNEYYFNDGKADLSKSLSSTFSYLALTIYLINLFDAYWTIPVESDEEKKLTIDFNNKITFTLNF